MRMANVQDNKKKHSDGLSRSDNLPFTEASHLLSLQYLLQELLWGYPSYYAYFPGWTKCKGGLSWPLSICVNYIRNRPEFSLLACRMIKPAPCNILIFFIFCETFFATISKLLSYCVSPQTQPTILSFVMVDSGLRKLFLSFRQALRYIQPHFPPGHQTCSVLGKHGAAEEFPGQLSIHAAMSLPMVFLWPRMPFLLSFSFLCSKHFILSFKHNSNSPSLWSVLC